MDLRNIRERVEDDSGYLCNENCYPRTFPGVVELVSTEFRRFIESFARRLGISSYHDREDVSQETPVAVGLYLRNNGFPDVRSWKSLVATSTRFWCLNWHRNQRVQICSTDIENEARQDANLADVDARDAVVGIVNAIEDDRIRYAAHLLFGMRGEPMSEADVCRQTGLTTRQLKKAIETHVFARIEKHLR